MVRARSIWRRDVRLVAALSLVALAARLVTFGNPIIQVDEEFYLFTARAMLHGALPYVDVWDRKPLGLFLIYLLPAALPASAAVYAYQALAFVCVLGTALLIVRISRRMEWTKGGFRAAVFYILWLDLADGQGGQSPVFYNLLVAVSVLMVIGGERMWRGRRYGRCAMAVVGVALQVKYTVLFEGVWIGLWLLWRDRLAGQSWRSMIVYGVQLCVLALTPTLAVLAIYVATGHVSEYLYANFVSIFARQADDASIRLNNGLVDLAILSPFIVMAALGARQSPHGGDRDRARFFIRGWFASSILGVVALGGWYNHYMLPVMLPGAVCSAAFLDSRVSGRRFFIPAAIVLFMLGQRIVLADVGRRGTRAQFYAIERAIGHAPGTLYVDWGEPAFYTFTDRQPLTRFVFPTHLQLAREAGAIGVEQIDEIRRIFRKRPDVVVLMGPTPLTKEEPSIARAVRALVGRGDYEAPTILPLGRLWVATYHRRHR